MLSLPDWEQLAERCQKPDHRRVGNWYARRVVRPAALRITWLVLPTGLSAHSVTLIAWATGFAAGGALGYGGLSGWLVGATLAQLWYLLDHVDGQIARHQGTASLDGVALDYLMHHTVSPALALGAGCGLAFDAGARGWLVAGVAWALGSLTLGLVHDARYKAFFQRLKRVDGRLVVVGGAIGRPVPVNEHPRRRGMRRLVGWLRQSLEPSGTINLLTLAAAACWFWDSLLVAKMMVALLAMLAPLAAVWIIVRAVRRETTEREFSAWFQAPEGSRLAWDRGWWQVRPDDERAADAARDVLTPARELP